MVTSFIELVLMATIAYSILQKKFESNSDLFKKFLNGKYSVCLLLELFFLHFYYLSVCVCKFILILSF